ncbi:hypothetical protein PoB_006245000 [Plakobranchus ocellatus]|uniref:Uncharacterized protein n=1 Tax=Plakobranchus ocellatus TaxID=259542 RepID=A0AAV4CVW4_9GAST|nr:hypothetical protein PoB_006245000 [Plakobranchus ocellatus]
MYHTPEDVHVMFEDYFMEMKMKSSTERYIDRRFCYGSYNQSSRGNASPTDLDGGCYMRHFKPSWMTLRSCAKKNNPDLQNAKRLEALMYRGRMSFKSKVLRPVHKERKFNEASQVILGISQELVKSSEDDITHP